jgi:hypothetical protein
MAGWLAFRPFSVDVVMALKAPDLGEFPRLVAEARFHSRLIARRSWDNLAPEIERWE